MDRFFVKGATRPHQYSVEDTFKLVAGAGRANGSLVFKQLSKKTDVMRVLMSDVPLSVVPLSVS